MTDTRESDRLDKDHPFDPDLPIFEIDEDRLGRVGYARALADHIRRWGGHESLVIGIYGPWGSGKTSLKNLVLDVLKKETKIISHNIQFSPWQWSSQEQIAEAFFREVGISLEDRGETHAAQKWWELMGVLDYSGEVGEGFQRVILFLLAAFSAIIGVGNVFVPSSGSLLITIISGSLFLIFLVLLLVRPAANWFAKFLMIKKVKRYRGIKIIRQEIKCLMKYMKHSLIISIDDIDRLTPREMRLVFQLVKSNADFPKFIYLLLFQQDIVIDGLQKESGKDSIINGHDYLEKVINVGLDLPIIDPSIVDEFINQKLKPWFERCKVSDSDRARFSDLYWKTLRHFFHDFRDVKRFLSTLYFHLSLFIERGNFRNVNIVDLIGLEILRIFEPKVYEQIPAIKHCLTITEVPKDRPECITLRAEVEVILKLSNQNSFDAVQEIFEDLFPLLRHILRDQVSEFMSLTNNEDSYRNCRVCHPYIFDRYFLLTLSRNDISHEEIEQLIEFPIDKARLLDELYKLIESGRFSEVLNRLEAYKPEMPYESMVSFIAALFDIGDEIINLSGTSVLTPEGYAAHIIRWFLRKNSDPRIRGDMLLQAANMSHGVFLVVRMTQEHGTDSQSAIRRSDLESIDSRSTEELQQIAAKKIEEIAKSGDLLRSEHLPLPYLLHHWKLWGGIEKPSEWLESKILSDDSTFLCILVKHLQKSTSIGMDHPEMRESWFINLEHLTEYVSINVLESRMKIIDDSGVVLEGMNKVARDCLWKAMIGRLRLFGGV